MMANKPVRGRAGETKRAATDTQLNISSGLPVCPTCSSLSAGVQLQIRYVFV